MIIKRRASTEPWGTPVDTGSEVKCFDLNFLSEPERHAMNQYRGVPVMPMGDNLSTRILLEIVSKAALKSRRTRMDDSLESATMSHWKP